MVVGYQPLFITDHLNLGVPDCRQTVSNNGQSSHTEGHRSQRTVVMQRHLDTLVGILVVHVMNDVHGIDIDTREPIHHLFELVDHIVKLKVLTLNSAVRRTYLLACEFVPAAVDGIEEALGEVGSGTEELHLLPYQHRGHATSDGSVISPHPAH